MADDNIAVATADTGGDTSGAPPPAAGTGSQQDYQFSDADLSAIANDPSWDAASEGSDAEGGEEGEGAETADAEADAGDTAPSDGEVESEPVEEDSQTSILDPTEDSDERTDGEAKSSDWTDIRTKAIDRAIKNLESQLAKRVTAADLPKELAKRRQAMSNALGRYTTLEDALLAGYSAQERIRSGQVRQPLPENASEAERAEWRQANNIPTEAGDYEIAKFPGHQWTEADIPVLDSFKEAAHAANFTQEQLNAATGWFVQRQEEARQELAERQMQLDRQDTQATRNLLRDQLEGDFGPSLTLMDRFLKDNDVFPEGIGEAIISARTADGHRLINNPAIAKFLIESARREYGDGAMITGQAAEAMNSEESELEKLLNTNIDEFQNGKWRNTGISPSERMLEISRQKASRGRRAA